VIDQAVAVMNGKDGVGRTSLVANIAALSAGAGWRVLAVDLDPQGALVDRLGCAERSDGGASLADVASGRRPDLHVLSDVRSGLDVVAGGPVLGAVANHHALELGGLAPDRSLTWLEGALAPLAEPYDLILIDTPPGRTALHLAAATAAHFVLVPTSPDREAIDGLAAIGALFSDVLSDSNPEIELLGVALTLMVPGAGAIERRARAALAELLADGAPVFPSTVRLAPRATAHVQQRGLLAHECHDTVVERTMAVTTLTGVEAVRATPTQFAEGHASSLDRLAGDYRALAGDVLGALTQAAVPAR
jgi:cellulose biosynthesis protein BcsQ